MKLVYCPECKSIYDLKMIKKQCACGKSWGLYVDAVNVVIGGSAVPIGFSLVEFLEAVKGGPKNKGAVFLAFVIPDDAMSIHRFEDTYARED